MQRISALDPTNTPAESKAMLDAVQKQLGIVPNLFKTVAHAPAALKFYLMQMEALGSGTLPATLREQIALVTAGTNKSDYCASAHTVLGGGCGVDANEAASSLRGHSASPKVEAALNFAKAIIEHKGNIDDAQLKAVRDAGYSDAEIVEMIANVSMNIFTNYFNLIAGTEIDFPHIHTKIVRAA